MNRIVVASSTSAPEEDKKGDHNDHGAGPSDSTPNRSDSGGVIGSCDGGGLLNCRCCSGGYVRKTDVGDRVDRKGFERAGQVRSGDLDFIRDGACRLQSDRDG